MQIHAWSLKCGELHVYITKGVVVRLWSENQVETF